MGRRIARRGLLAGIAGLCAAGAHAAPRQRRDSAGTRLQIAFSARDRSLIVGYYGGGGAGGLPPGLQRNVDRRGALPPGLQRQYEQRGRLPPGLERRLSPLPAGYAYRVRGSDVVILSIRDGRIVDLIVNIVR